MPRFGDSNYPKWVEQNLPGSPFSELSGRCRHPPAKRKDRRVEFSRGVDFHMAAIDGAWRRACGMMDVSTGGAKLIVTEPLEGLKITEFFQFCLARVWRSGAAS